jgi:CBS domain-containing protein
MKLRPYCVEDIGTSELVVVPPETTLIECAKRMHDLNVSCLVVASLDDAAGTSNNIPQGILTDRDIVVEAVAFALDPTVITAGDIMTCPVVTARLDEALKEVHARMLISEISSIVVVDDLGALVGLLAAEKVNAVLLEGESDDEPPS